MHIMSGGNTNSVDMVYLDFAKAFDKIDHVWLYHCWVSTSGLYLPDHQIDNYYNIMFIL